MIALLSLPSSFSLAQNKQTLTSYGIKTALLSFNIIIIIIIIIYSSFVPHGA
jgi:hypothetical protein